ncbi:hypothetical protein INT43_004850 [Umbelopsis isabellina]|uniref:Arginase n=1 Tax=Mortierella isabellina TaxID=91625 RepID=A0A8H7PE91_MORIS|nr:hypothetical protein INT43_004850 [Umbelopsis isabellina]
MSQFINAVDGYKYLKSRRTAVLAYPFNGGQGRAGVELGGMHLVEHGILEQLKEMNWETKFSANEDLQTLQPASDEDIVGLKKPRYVSAVTKRVAQQVSDAAKAGDFVLTLGGDHSLAMGTVSGVFDAYPDACLIWIDAHADINTPESTESGNMHGCPLSFVMGLAGEISEFSWIKNCLASDRLVYIGLRDVDDAEKKILKDNNIKAFSMHHVDKYGIGKVVEMALDHVNPNRDRPIHLSFDVDALDPSVAPSTGTPVRGGLTFREGHYICEALAETGLLVAADIMEVNPALEDEQAVFQTVQVGCSLTRCCLGETLL